MDPEYVCVCVFTLGLGVVYSLGLLLLFSSVPYRIFSLP